MADRYDPLVVHVIHSDHRIYSSHSLLVIDESFIYLAYALT